MLTSASSNDLISDLPSCLAQEAQALASANFVNFRFKILCTTAAEPVHHSLCELLYTNNCSSLTLWQVGNHAHCMSRNKYKAYHKAS